MDYGTRNKMNTWHKKKNENLIKIYNRLDYEQCAGIQNFTNTHSLKFKKIIFREQTAISHAHSVSELMLILIRWTKKRLFMWNVNDKKRKTQGIVPLCEQGEELNKFLRKYRKQHWCNNHHQSKMVISFIWCSCNHF